MSKRRNIILKCLLTTPTLTVEVQFAEILSVEDLFTAIRRIFGPQKFLAIRYSAKPETTLTINNPRSQGLCTEPSKHHTVGGTIFTHTLWGV